jgi:hypothetical protein
LPQFFRLSGRIEYLSQLWCRNSSFVATPTTTTTTATRTRTTHTNKNTHSHNTHTTHTTHINTPNNTGGKMQILCRRRRNSAVKNADLRARHELASTLGREWSR